MIACEIFIINWAILNEIHELWNDLHSTFYWDNTEYPVENICLPRDIRSAPIIALIDQLTSGHWLHMISEYKQNVIWEHKVSERSVQLKRCSTFAIL